MQFKLFIFSLCLVLVRGQWRQNQIPNNPQGRQPGVPNRPGVPGAPTNPAWNNPRGQPTNPANPGWNNPRGQPTNPANPGWNNPRGQPTNPGWNNPRGQPTNPGWNNPRGQPTNPGWNNRGQPTNPGWNNRGQPGFQQPGFNQPGFQPGFQPGIQPNTACQDGSRYGGPGGTTPLPMPKHCRDIFELGGRRNGVYTIYVSSVNECGRKEVYCDQRRDGGGWTVIQRRIDGRLNFVRGWEEYKHGFGFLDGEFWLGNEWIYKIAMQGPHELRVDLGDFQQQQRFAKYRVFSIADEMGNYTLRVERFDPQSNSGDALSGHNNIPFSTIDRDNDRWSGNCARQYSGAWWYTSCHNSNLNGAYLRGPNRQYARGVVWNQWRGYSYSLRFTEMKIRPLV